MDSKKAIKAGFLYLTEEDADNPIKVIEELFDLANLTEMREMLWQWYRAMTTDTFKQLGPNEKIMITVTYESCLRLIEATYLLLPKKPALHVSN